MKAYTPMNWVRRKTWIGIVLIAIGLLGWWIKEMRFAQKQTAVTAVQRSVTDKRWEYGWVKPPDVKGLVPSIRQERHEARIIYYDQFRFDMVIYLRENGTEALFSWDKVKNPNHGEWRQPSPENYGKWYLEPERMGDRTPTSFHGWETNKKGEMTPIWLRAVD